MPVSLKSITPKQIEDAIAKVLADLTGNECSISVSELRFETTITESMTGRESVSISAKASLGRLNVGDFTSS